jgi:hypothetical protein
MGVTALLVVLALMGTGIATGLSSFLGIRTEPKTVPEEHPVAAPERPFVLPPRLVGLDAPDDERTGLAVDELRSAIHDAGGTQGSVRLTVSRGTDDSGDDSYRLLGTPRRLVISAGSTAGAVRGVYDLAQQVRAGRSISEHLGEEVTSRLPFRMVDLGAVGVEPDPAAYRSGTDYTHYSGAFSDVMLPQAPYVDQAALAVAERDLDAYAAHVLAEGYNAIAVPGFLEYLTFDGLGVYDEGDDHVARALAMREAFGPLWQHLHDLGLKVYFRTDMLALSTPLQHYLEDRFGGLTTEDPDLWGVYAQGLDELYAAMPYVDGVLIRIGEAGTVYDQQGWDYYSSLDVTTVAAVRAMLTAFTDEADRVDRDVIFRTWSVGVGAVGDMHTSPDSYHAVLDGLDSPHLIVSTKYTLGDFYSWQPLNDTLETGDQRRIIELQSRREFEGYGALPNDLGPLYQLALRRFLAANPHIEGIWTWTQDGGPWRAGPLTLELKAGFWQLYELNTIQAARLARDPDADPAQITADWAFHYLSRDPVTVAAIGELMAQSRVAITHGLYIPPYAEQRVFAIGLEPPPMMWIFEWDILTGDSAVLDLIYAVSRDAGRLPEATTGGDDAFGVLEQGAGLSPLSDPEHWRTPRLRDALMDSVLYESQTLTMLSAYRAMTMHHAAWLDTGDRGERQIWEGARDQFLRLAAEHESFYDGDLDHPAYNLTAARIGVTRAERDRPMGELASALLLLLGIWAGMAFFGDVLGSAGSASRALWTAGLRPWRAAEAVAELGTLTRWLVVLVPLAFLVTSRLAFAWFAAPAHLVITGLGWLVFVGVVLLGAGPRRWAVVAAVGGAVQLRVVLLSWAMRGRGPGRYWFAFWTEPGARTAYVVVAFVAFAWVLVAAAWAASSLSLVGVATGLALAAGGGLVGAIGLERALTMWNDQMALLPWGLSRILGITTYLGIPTSLPWYAAGVGAMVVVLSLLGRLVAAGRRRRLLPQ